MVDSYDKAPGDLGKDPLRPNFELELLPWPSFELEWSGHGQASSFLPSWLAATTKLLEVQAAVGSDGRAPEELWASESMMNSNFQDDE
ncbi:hypothetical protein NL676_031709 [Syzygium grande]|nr:hypothetical protein NL676_031709 [Syzygium grande]